MKERFVLEFEKQPALLFVQNGTGSGFDVFQDGKQIRGIRSITIRAAYDDATTHEIEYLTGTTKEERG